MDSSRRDWDFTPHQSYGILGWVQHGIKFVALVVALLSWAQFITDNGNNNTIIGWSYEIPRILEIVIFAVLLTGYLIGLVLRWKSSEVFNFGFQLLHIVAHIILLLSLIYQYDPSVFIFIYGLLLLLGELVQVMFLFMRTDDAIHDIYDLPRWVVWTYSVFCVICYVLLLICQIAIATATYQKFHGN